MNHPADSSGSEQGFFKRLPARLTLSSLLLSACILAACDPSAEQPAAHSDRRSPEVIPSVATDPSVSRQFITLARVPGAASDRQFDLSPWQRARIDWRQFEGASLTVLGDAQGAFESLLPLLPAFEQLTGIQVGMVLIQQEEMRKRLRTDLSSGGGIYDVVPKGITDLGEAHFGRWLEPLQPYIDDTTLTDADWFNFADFSPRLLALCKVGDTLLSLPFDFSGPVFMYRKDLFEKYTITVPDTWEELVQMKRKLQAALDADGLQMDAFTTRTTVGAGDNTWTIIPAIRAYGGDMFDAHWRPVFNSPQAVRALEVYRDAVTGDGAPAESLTQHFVEQRRLFRDGKLASGIFASHIFDYLNDPDASRIVGKWDGAPPPRGPAGRYTSPWAWAFALNAGSRNKKAAWLFMQWAASRETAQWLSAGVGPARRSVWSAEYAQKIQAPGLVQAYQWIFDQGENSAFQMGVPEFPEAGLIASKAFSEIFYGAPVQATLDEAVVRVEQVMARGPSRKQLNQAGGHGGN
jgi:multiple sugar transport system substrate-binding protein